MINTSKSLEVALLALLLSLCALVFVVVNMLSDNEPKTVYVSNVELFNNFDMAKDMAYKHETVIQQKKVVFDSLYNIYSILQKQKNVEKLKSLEQQLQQKDTEIKQMEQYLTQTVSQQVWDRLNVYVKEFGEQNAYKFILGTQGSGNVMYADKELNVTNELIEFVNEKYQAN